MKPENDLQATIAVVLQPGKGILAADESVPTITKRFSALGIDCTDESRRAYRSLLITTPGAEHFLSGVILFEETLAQSADDGTPLPQVLARRGIMPGIKVDKGTTPLVGAPGDLITQGLDGLAERLKTAEEAIARSNQRQALTQVMMANSITSLRTIARLDWSTFVEASSAV